MKKNFAPRACAAVVAVLAVASIAISLSGCGGGGSAGPGIPPAGPNSLLRIEAAGIPAPLWEYGTGPSAGCAAPVALNATLVFTFSGPVSASSLPQAGIALGSINVITGSTVPAQGTFFVQDDPSVAPGNLRRVLFVPTPPTDPNNPTVAGFLTNSNYSVQVFGGASAGSSVQVSGLPLAASASSCFFTCNPPPGNPNQCFTDPVAGPPHVVSTTPNSADPSPAAILPNSIASNTVSVFFSEPIAPANVDLANVRLLRLPSGAQVPGSVIFYQAGSVQAAQGGTGGARVDYVANDVLLSSSTYELVISNGVRDFGNNPTTLYSPATAPPSGRRFFTTVAVPFCPQPTIIEDFSTTTNRFSVTGVVQWNGGVGATLSAILPTEYVGSGLFGAMSFAAGSHTLDTGLAASAGFAQGAWNTTTVTVDAGAVVRMIGTGTGSPTTAPPGWTQGGLPITIARGPLANKYPAHIRCRGAVIINGQFNGSAGTNAATTAAYGSAEQGPRLGQFNNGSGTTPNIIAGGTGGPGAGEGGRASQSGAVRTDRGEGGYGAPELGVQNVGPAGANPNFGGGGGGKSNFRNPGAGVPGDLGGLGGAGGSAFQPGGNGGPTSTLLTGCTPFVPTSPLPGYVAAPSSGQPSAFTTPITTQSGGSGGGGGGDRWEVAGVTQDDQGGGGGGGGGGVRISAVGDITVGATGIIAMNGASGSAGSSFFGGAGGGGSGGEIWLQSFSQIIVANSANMTVNAGGAASTCGDQSSGVGGRGVYQFEDSDGIVNTSFIGGSTANGNISAVTFPFSANVSGTAVSNFFDLGYGSPDVTGITTNFSIGNAPGAVVTITFQGAFEALSGGGADPATLSAPVTAANFNLLDGYRFIRFTATIAYSTAALLLPVPPTLPSVSLISIAFNTPCP